MKSFHMYTIAATGGRFRPTTITVLLERGRASFESFPHFGKQQIKRRKTGASNIQADADRCKQTVSLVDVTQSLDNNIFDSQIDLVGSAKMLATAYRLKCTPLSRPLTAIDIGQLKLNNG